MSYEFFFSYTHGDQDGYLDTFFERLSDAVRKLRQLPEGAEVGFRDQNDVELGTQWDPHISDALQNSKVLVSLYSPAYFSSPYCGKEWETFWQRCEMFRSQQNHNQLPPCIKPVIWKELDAANLTQRVQDIQYKRGDPNAEANNEGVRFLIKALSDHRPAYNKFVNDLASDIVLTSDQYDLPRLNPLPVLSQVRSAWEAVTAPGAPAAPLGPTSRVTGPKHIRFVFVAADPNAFGNVREAGPYLDNGAGDWKPFYPDTSAIGPFVQHVVSDKEFGFTSDELRFSNSLIQEIEDAWDARKIVLILVDGWSVNWEASYQQVLHALDGRNFYNCSVLIPWNDNDPAAQQEKVSILNTLKNTFSFRSAGNNIFYRDNIRTPEELREALRDVLTRLKAEMRREADIATGRPIPTDILKPIISGPGTAGLGR